MGLIGLPTDEGPQDHSEGERDETDDDHQIERRLVLLAERIQTHGAQRSPPVLSSR